MHTKEACAYVLKNSKTKPLINIHFIYRHCVQATTHYLKA